MNAALNFTCGNRCCDGREAADIRPMRGIRPVSVYLTLAGAAGPWHGRTVQIRVSRSSLHRGFSLVTREETPIPQLREHGDQSVVWTGHSLSSLGRLHSGGATDTRDKRLWWGWCVTSSRPRGPARRNARSMSGGCRGINRLEGQTDYSGGVSNVFISVVCSFFFLAQSQY